MATKIKEAAYSIEDLADVIYQSKDVNLSARDGSLRVKKWYALEKRIIDTAIKINPKQPLIEMLVCGLCGALGKSSKPVYNFRIPIQLIYTLVLKCITLGKYTPEEFKLAPSAMTTLSEMGISDTLAPSKIYDAHYNSVDYAILQNLKYCLSLPNSALLSAKEFVSAYGRIGKNHPSLRVLYEEFAKVVSIFIKDNKKPSGVNIPDWLFEPEKDLLPDWFFKNK